MYLEVLKIVKKRNSRNHPNSNYDMPLLNKYVFFPNLEDFFLLFTCCNTTLVCGWTPSTTSTSTTPPSQILTAVETSPEKSTCPGESIRLIR